MLGLVSRSTPGYIATQRTGRLPAKVGVRSQYMSHLHFVQLEPTSELCSDPMKYSLASPLFHWRFSHSPSINVLWMDHDVPSNKSPSLMTPISPSRILQQISHRFEIVHLSGDNLPSCQYFAVNAILEHRRSLHSSQRIVLQVTILHVSRVHVDFGKFGKKRKHNGGVLLL